MSATEPQWRAWGLTVVHGDAVLRSPEFGRARSLGLDYPKRTARAVCFEADHAPPHPDCVCGMYSASTRDGCTFWLPAGSVAVLGRVRLLGRTLDHAPDPANRLAEELARPAADAYLGMRTAPERRSAGVRLVGRQGVAPRYAAAIPALEARYGGGRGRVRFVVDDRLADERGAADRFERAAADLREWSRSLLVGPEDDRPRRERAERAAGLLLLNQAGTHVLLQRRSDHVDHPGTWAVVGGLVEPGESATEAALREAWEEHRLTSADLVVEQVVKVKRSGGPRYRYVVARTPWDPATDDDVVASTSFEADGAMWFPVDVLDRPDAYPRLRLHPGLRRDWPTVREATR